MISRNDEIRMTNDEIKWYAGYKGEQRPISFIENGKEIKIKKVIEEQIVERIDTGKRIRVFHVETSQGKYRLEVKNKELKVKRIRKQENKKTRKQGKLINLSTCQLVILLTAYCLLLTAYCLPLTAEEYPRISVKPPHSFPYKGIYLSYISAYHIDRYIDKINNSEINCIVVDFKNAHGFVTYNTEVEFAEEIGAKLGTINLEKLSKICENNGIYLIGRIVLFQDSVLAFYNKGEFAIRTVDNKIWSDGHGKYWVDPCSKNVRDYNIEIAKDIAKRGVKEVQFDYVRFPSRSGRFTPYTLAYEIEGISKEQVIGNFLKEAKETLSSMDVIIACDVYGYTLWLPSLKEEGQRLEAMADNVDIICPMLYPSHFHKNFMKSAIPFEREYNCIYKSLVKGKERISAKGRSLPDGRQAGASGGQNNSVGFVSYIQGFNLRSPNFGPEYIENQINAVEKADIKGYIVWNAGGNYKSLFELFKK